MALLLVYCLFRSYQNEEKKSLSFLGEKKNWRMSKKIVNRNETLELLLQFDEMRLNIMIIWKFGSTPPIQIKVIELQCDLYIKP